MYIHTCILVQCISYIINAVLIYYVLLLQGEPKEKEEMPEKVNMFSEDVPNTNAGNYGNRTSTEIGQAMQQMEFKFHSANRKRKMGGDLICYWIISNSEIEMDFFRVLKYIE